MKKLLLKVLYFLLPVFLLLVFLPMNKRSKYLGMKDDCINRCSWIFDRIHNNQLPIDVLFLGTSKTANGINDRELSKRLTDQQVVNFGYCRFGRNLHYALLKEVLEKKQPKVLLIEIRESESKSGHSIFPFIANTSDVVLSYPFFNKHVASDVWNHLSYKIELAQEQLFYSADTVAINLARYGYIWAEGNASKEDLEKNKRKWNDPKRKFSEFEKDFHFNFAHNYLQKIAALCEKKNVTLQLLYLPSYGVKTTENSNFERYTNYGNVLIPPSKLLENENNWYDVNHLNVAGAAELTDWLTTVLSRTQEN